MTPRPATHSSVEQFTTKMARSRRDNRMSAPPTIDGHGHDGLGTHHDTQLRPDLDPYPDIDPWSDRTAIAHVDVACRALLDDVVASLILLRGGHPKDPGATISVLASLIAEADSRLPDAVADARDHRYTWDRIAERLGTTIPTAQRRYSAHHRVRTELRASE